MPYRLLFACCWLLVLARPALAQGPASPTPPPPEPLPWLRPLLEQSAGLRPHFVGLSLVDAATGETLFGYNDAKGFTPASVTKVLSVAAGLRLLGDSLPALRYFRRGDTLFFQGTGDPTLLHGDVPGRRAFDFLRSHPGQLAYCERACVPAYGPGWAWDDYAAYYQPERGPFPIYGHTVRFYSQAAPTTGPAQPALTRLRARPRFFQPLTGALPAGAPPATGPAEHLRRDPLANRFYVLPSQRRWVDEVPFRTGPALLQALLQDTLRQPVALATWHPLPTDTVRVLPGLPADSLYRRLLRVSDNFLAEQLLLMVSSPLGDDSLSTGRAIRAARRGPLADLPDPLTWVDGSGLSRLNLATPRTYTAVLARLHHTVPEARLLSLLAAGGGPGTLRKRYQEGGRAWVWGKTGSLTHVCNLVGYLRTRSGRLLAFSFFNNGIGGDDALVRNEMERLLREVRNRL